MAYLWFGLIQENESEYHEDERLEDQIARWSTLELMEHFSTPDSYAKEPGDVSSPSKAYVNLSQKGENITEEIILKRRSTVIKCEFLISHFKSRKQKYIFIIAIKDIKKIYNLNNKYKYILFLCH